jgi:hypothetical protein
MVQAMVAPTSDHPDRGGAAAHGGLYRGECDRCHRHHSGQTDADCHADERPRARPSCGRWGHGGCASGVGSAGAGGRVGGGGGSADAVCWRLTTQAIAPSTPARSPPASGPISRLGSFAMSVLLSGLRAKDASPHIPLAQCCAIGRDMPSGRCTIVAPAGLWSDGAGRVAHAQRSSAAGHGRR